MAYVERNPVRSFLVTEAEDYLWSSARPRLTGTSGLVDLAPWQNEYDWPRWKRVLQTSLTEAAFGQRLQETSRCGRPLGPPAFVEDLERRCGRNLRALAVGRPKKLLQKRETQLALGNCV